MSIEELIEEARHCLGETFTVETAHQDDLSAVVVARRDTRSFVRLCSVTQGRWTSSWEGPLLTKASLRRAVSKAVAEANQELAI